MKKHLYLIRFILLLLISLTISGCAGNKQKPELIVEQIPTITPMPKIDLPTPTLSAKDFCHEGDELFQNEEFEAALMAYESAVSQQPDDGCGYLGRGLTMLQLDRFDDARLDFDQVKKLEMPADRHEQIYELVTELNYLEEYDKAGVLLDLLLFTDPENIDYLYERAFYQFNQGAYEQAVIDLNQILKVDPKNYHALVLRGNCHDYLGDLDQALDDYASAISMEPEWEQAYYERGSAYFNQDDYELAMTDLNKAIEIQPAFEDAYRLRGEIYFNQKDYDRARDDFDTLIKIAPNNPFGYLGRGRLFYQDQSNVQLAFEDINHAIELAPNEAEGYFIRGLMYLLTDGIEEFAIKDLDKTIELNPQHSQAYLTRGVINFELGDYQKALEDIEAALKNRLNPNMQSYAEELETRLQSITKTILLDGMLPVNEPPPGTFGATSAANDFDTFIHLIYDGGNWKVVQELENLYIIPIPSGWSGYSIGAGKVLFEFYPSENQSEPSARIIIRDYCSTIMSLPSLLQIIEVELESGLQANIVDNSLVDSVGGYILYTMEANGNVYRGIVVLPDKYYFRNDIEHCFPQIHFAAPQADWDTFFPLFKIIIFHWYEKEGELIGFELPDRVK